VAKQQGAGAAGDRRLARADVTEQEQPQSGSERRRRRSAENGPERCEPAHESAKARRANGERGGRGDQCHVIKLTVRSSISRSPSDK